MQRRPRPARALIAAVLAACVTAGCAAITEIAPPSRSRGPSDAAARIARLRSIAVVTPRVTVHDLGIAGAPESNEKWSRIASENLLTVLRSRLDRPGRFAIVDYPDDHEALFDPGRYAPWTPVDETWEMFVPVAEGIMGFTYSSMERRALRSAPFDYSFGRESSPIASAVDADGFLLLFAEDNISTLGRKAFLGLISVAIGIQGGVYIPEGGRTMLAMAVVEGSTGDVLWFNAAVSAGAYDLRDAESCERIMNRLMHDFPNP